MKNLGAASLPHHAWRVYDGMVAPNVIAGTWLVVMWIAGETLAWKLVGVAGFLAAQLMSRGGGNELLAEPPGRAARWEAAMVRGIKWYERAALPVVGTMLLLDSRGVTMTAATSAGLLVLAPRLAIMSVAVAMFGLLLPLALVAGLMLAARLSWVADPRPPGSTALKVAKLLLGGRVATRVFGQVIYDGVEEWAEANGGGRRWLARWIKVRTYVHIVIQLLSMVPRWVFGLGSMVGDD